MTFIDYGLGAFKAEALRCLLPSKHIDLADTYRRLLAAGELAGL